MLGRFRDLLGATAKHPAMLFYLDNWLSVAAGYAPRRHGRGAGAKAKASGLNENYARELMELHTLGVDGGYTQQDVTELARMLTGWTLQRTRATLDCTASGDGLRLRRRRATTTATSTGWAAPSRAGGQAEGEFALDVLARIRPPRATSHQAGALLRADEPPPALVERMARASSTATATSAPCCAPCSRAPNSGAARRSAQVQDAVPVT